MPKQTALDTINRLIAEENSSGATRQRTGDAVRTIDQLIAEEEENDRRREEERQRQQRNAASATEAMDLVRTYGDYGLERRAAEQPQPVKEERRVGNALTPEMEARYQQANGVNRAPTAYQTYMMQAMNAQPRQEETRSTDELRRDMNRQNRLAKATTRMAADMGNRMTQDQSLIYNPTYTSNLRTMGQTMEAQQEKADRATELYQTLSVQRREREEREKYAALMSNPDFVAKSQGDPTIGNKTSSTSLAPAERLYQKIFHRNDTKDANGNIRDAAGSDAARFVNDEEAAIFYYLWNTQGAKAAQSYYYGYVENRAGERRVQLAQQQAQAYGKYDPVGASIARVGYNALSGIGLVDMALQNLTRALGITDRNKPLNYNSDAQLPGQVADALQSGASSFVEQFAADEIKRINPNVKHPENYAKVASFLYQTGMSMADSSVAIAMNLMGIPEPLTLANMGAAAGTRAIREARERGATDGQALAFGFSSAIMEALFEKISLDRILEPSYAQTTKAHLLNALKQSFTEGSEEVMTTLANTAADMLIMGDKAELYAIQRQLMEQGVSEKEALSAAFKQWGTGIVGDLLGGMISGFGMGGAKEVGTGLGVFAQGVRQDVQIARALTDYQNAQQAAPQITPQQTPATPAQQRQPTAREQNPLQFALNKAQNGETVTGNDAKAILNDPQAVQTLRDAGVLAENIRPGAEGRTQIQQAVQALAEQNQQETTQERTAPPLPRQMAQEQQERVSTPPLPQNAQNEAQEPTLRVRAQEEQAPQQRETLRIRENEVTEPTRQAPLTIRGANATVEENRQEESYGQGQQTETAAAAGEGDFRSRAETAAEGARRSYLDRIERSSGLGRVLQDLRNYRVVRGAESRASEVSRIRNQAKDGNQRDVSAQDYGVTNGSAELSAKELDNATASRVLGRNWDRAVAELARQGVTLKAMTGQLKKEDGTQVRAFFSGDGKTIVVQADHPKLSWNQLLDHEDLHRRIKADKNYRKAVEDALLADRNLQAYLPEIIDRYARAYAAADPGLSSDDVIEELLADYRAGFDMLDPLGMNPITARAAKRAAKDIKAVEQKGVKQTGENRHGQPTAYSEDGTKATVDDVAVASNIVDTITEDPRPFDYMSADKSSIETFPDWAQNFNKRGGENAQQIVDAIRQFTEAMIASDVIMGYVPVGSVAYNKTGPLRKNIEYVFSFDMDASCPRTFQFLNYRNELQRIAGRPLTYAESIQLIELMRAYGQQIPCSYCYVENKRVLLANNYLNWFGFYDRVVGAETDEEARKLMYGYNEKKDSLSKGAESELARWRKADKDYRPKASEVWLARQTAKNSVFNWLDQRNEAGLLSRKTGKNKIVEAVCKEFKVTDKAAKAEITDFVGNWVYDRDMKIPHNYEIVNDTNVSEVDQRALNMHRTAMAYANSASSARTVDNYMPYTDQIWNVTAEQKRRIMAQGGIRKHSSNDFRMDYVQDYFMFFADLAAGGWTGHTYTKNVDYVKIFGRTGDRINVSVAFTDENGQVRENMQEGMGWKDAQQLRKDYAENVGVMAMVTSDAQLSYALNSDWIDMIIPFHASGLDKSVWYNIRMWQDYTSKQNERWYTRGRMEAELKDAGVTVPKEASSQEITELYRKTFNIKMITNKDGLPVKPHFLPGSYEVNGQTVPGHNNDKEKYFQLCKEYGVVPRFQGILVDDGEGNMIDVTEHRNYMKLVKETARTDVEQKPIQFNFDQVDPALGMTPFEYAMQRMEEEARNGGYANTAEDKFGIVKEFQEEYLGKNIPLPTGLDENGKPLPGNLTDLLTDRAIAFREGLMEMQNQAAQEQAQVVEESQQEGKASTEIDTDYLAAVDSGDMETAQRMVDEAAKKAGYTVRKYHQTDVPNIHVFDIGIGTHGGTDSETPYGIFTKNTRADIGLGDIQMSLYLKPGKTFVIKDRSELRSRMPEAYNLLATKLEEVDAKYNALVEEAEDALFDAQDAYEEKHPEAEVTLDDIVNNRTYDDPACQRANEHWKAVMAEWSKEADKIRVQAKEVLSKYLRDSGYDSMEIKLDKGTNGRSTDTFIVFSPEQVKSADPVTYDDNGKVIPLSQRFNTKNEDTRFSREIRPEVVDRLDKQIKDGNYVIVYHSLYQDKDGNLYSPMAGKKKVGDKWVMTNPYDLNAWYKSDAPENIADLIENGTVKLKDSGGWSFLLKKPDAGGTDVPAALNPWNHASTDALNDQFNAAFARETDEGELVTVESIIPLSEVDPSVAVDPETGKVETKPYEELGMVTDRDVVAKPDSQNKKLKVPTNIPAGTIIKPKDSVGLKMWKAGPVHGQISGKRPVYLSRWIRNTRVLSTEETAKMIAKTLKDENFSGTIPGNVVGLKLRQALENEGVKFGTPTNKGYYAYMAERGYTKSQAEGEPLSGSTSIEIDPEVAAQFSPEAIARRQSNRAKGVKGERKVSRVRSNTYEYSGLYNEVEAQMDEADEENYTYDPVSEKKSMNEALGRLKADFDGEVSRLSETDRQWGGSDLDTAMGILHRYRTEGRATGDYGDFWRWSKVIQEKGTKGGQFIQAFAKYTRTGTGAAMKGAKDIHDRFKLNPAQQKQVDAAKKKLMDGIDGDMSGAAQDAMKQAKGQKGGSTSGAVDNSEELKAARRRVEHLESRVRKLKDELAKLKGENRQLGKANDRLATKEAELKKAESDLEKARRRIDLLSKKNAKEIQRRKDAERLVREISKLFEKQQNHGEPVENWLNLTGEELARKIAGRFSEPKQRTKTTMQTILSDLVGFAEEHALLDRKKAEGTKRTAIDTITDYLNNKDAYGTAWAAAQSYLRAAYTDDQEKLDALNSFLTATIAYNAEGTDRTMLDAILQSADVLGISEKRILELTSAGATASTIDRIGDELVNQVKERMGADYDESFTQQLKDAVRRHITGIALQESAEEQRLRLGGMTTDAARQLEMNLQKLLTQSRGDKNRAAQSVADYLIRELGIPSSDAAIAAERVTGAFMDELANRADRKLQQMFAAKAPKTQEQRDRLLDLIRLGGLTNSNVEDAVVDALGLGGMSRERQRELVGAMAQFGETLDAMEADDLDGLKELIRAQAAVRNTPLSRQAEKALAGETDAQYLREFALAQLDAIAGDFAEMSPGAKISTFQTISHLLNMRTALRNLTSNQVFDLVDSAANNLATIPDMVIGAFTGKRTVGTNKSWLSEMKRAGAKQGAARNALEVRLDVSPDDRQKSKYGTAGRRTNSMAASNAFGRILSHLEEVMGYELNTTDEFHKGSVRGETLESLARFVERGDITQEQANAWAEEEALYRSFQDDTLVGNILSGVKELANIIGFGDSGKKNTRGRTIHDFGLGDLVVKYTQVPGALIHRGIEYSPLGYAKMIYDLAIAKDSLVRTQRRGEDVTNAQRKLALDIGRATTGSGLITLFAVLAKAGLLRRDDDDKDKNAKAMHAAQGLSGTQLNLTALGRWISGEDAEPQDGDVLADIGFLEPLDSLMTIATLMAKDEDLSISDVGVKSLDGVWKAISNTSAMQTISNIISTVQYHDEENDLPLYFQIPIEIASDSVSGFIPSPVRQLAQATDTTYRDQYRSKALNDQIRAKVMNSIPGVRQMLAPKITPLGEDKKYQKPLLNYLNATLNPGNINVYQASDVVDELNRVYGETDDAKIWPERNAPYSFTANDEKWTLTPDERTQFQRTRGQTTAKAMEAVMGTDWYKSMGATDQAEVLNWIGNFSNFVAKKEMLESRGQEYGSTTYNKYYEAWQSGTPIEEVVADKYGKLIKVAEETAAAETIIAEAKIPEASKEEAETMSADAKRLYAAFLQGGVSDATARNLATSMEGSEASGHEQWRMVYDAAGKEGEKAVTSVMTDDMKRNWNLAKDAGVSMDDYIKVREGFKDLNGNGNKSQDEWNATLDSFTFSTNSAKDKSIKGTLWQILTGSGSTKNNPYDKEAGQKVIDAKSGGGSGSGSYAPVRIPTLRLPEVPKVAKPSSGLVLPTK